MNIVTRSSLSQQVLGQLPVLIPSNEQQTQIVEYLDEKTQKIDSTIEKETQRIELLKEYRQSLISEVVTGKFDVRDWKE
jgi:type I restriction enzyme S subunit